MTKPVSFGGMGGTSCDSFELVEALRWIHADLSPAECLETLQHISRDIAQANPPAVLVIRDSQGFSAAAYFRILPGSVATLGGIRASLGNEVACANLLRRLSSQLQANNIQQIQSVIDSTDDRSLQLLQLADFERITHVVQLWLDLEGSQPRAHKLPSNANWIPAHHFSMKQLAQLIEDTFMDTLDCPMLNYLRKPENVLLSFLEGKELSADQPWFVLQDETRQLGCVFLSSHSPELCELVYMGLNPEARGLGLGQILTEKAIDISRQQGSRILLVGVDESNWPALRIYQRLAFVTYRRLAVLFRNEDLRTMSSAAQAHKNCNRTE